ncbi:MAG: PVC-type heme-binding CxxCH protein [Verrucomicrobiales bacterium]
MKLPIGHPPARSPARPPTGGGSLRQLFVAVAAGVWVTAQPAAGEIPKPEDAPLPRPPEQSAAAFRLPDGFAMDLVASEPLIASPSGLCWMADGSLFVSELHGYNLAGQLDIEELNKSGRLDTEVRRVQADERFKQAAAARTFGSVKRLRDTNGDGRLDHAETWANDLPPVYGLAPARDGVIAACAPHIVFLADRNKDGHAEVRETLFTGFGTGELERGINAPQWDVDGWIYFGRGWDGGLITGPRLPAPVRLPGSNFRIRADGTAIEPVTGHSHTFGLAITESGEHVTVSTTTGFSVAPIPWRSLMRNPDAAVAGLQTAIGDRRAYGISRPHPWRLKRAEDPLYFEFYKSRYGAAESEATGWFTAACGPLVYRDHALPGLHGQYFVCEPAGNFIHRSRLLRAGAGLALQRVPGEERSEFAASDDSWSHPMHLLHGPDGAIWVVDYYREIIEDYSAIPRHLQQQYGVYAGHDRGRVYRLIHRDMPAAPNPDMSRLDAAALAHECASPYLWRRLTAQRLLVERQELTSVPTLRSILADPDSTSAALITALRTLDPLEVIKPEDVRPLVTHPSASVRGHALPLAERWLSGEIDAGVVDSVLAAAATETDPRVLIQCALTLGESRDSRAFALLVRYARERLDLRWMETALLSSLAGRGHEMLAELIREPGKGLGFLSPLAQSIAARGDEPGLAAAVMLLPDAGEAVQSTLLDALTKGRRHAARHPLNTPAARNALAGLAASASAPVRERVRAFEETLVASAIHQPTDTPEAVPPPAPDISEESFRATLTAAQSSPRNLDHGHEVFRQACATCHRLDGEGHEVGPDFMGELSQPEETLARHLLMPNERIRPGYETYLFELRSGPALVGLLKDDGATSVTVALPGGADQVVLRKDLAGVRRLPVSLMPSFAAASPSELASLIGWLRSRVTEGPTDRVLLFDEEPDFADLLTRESGTARVVRDHPHSGRFCLHITPPQRAAATIPGWQFDIVENPASPKEFRFLRLSWRAGADGAMIELARGGQWPKPDEPAGRYFAGRNTSPWQAHQASLDPPRSWQTVTFDLWKDLGATTLTGIAPTAMGGDAWFDRIELLKRIPLGQ